MKEGYIEGIILAKIRVAFNLISNSVEPYEIEVYTEIPASTVRKMIVIRKEVENVVKESKYWQRELLKAENMLLDMGKSNDDRNIL